MSEQFTYQELQKIHHFFPEADIPEKDLRFLSVLEVARLKGLYLATINLIISDFLTSIRFTTHKPTIPSLLWLLHDVNPAVLTKTIATRLDQAYDPKKETLRAAGILEHPQTPLQVVSIEHKQTKAPRGLVFYSLEKSDNRYNKPFSSMFTRRIPQGV